LCDCKKGGIILGRRAAEGVEGKKKVMGGEYNQIFYIYV
jgi:hypothetical protein